MTDKEALDRIFAIMDGEEWSANTLDEIADVLAKTGREVRDTWEQAPNEGDS